ncbi:PHP domain-containing protein [Solihabitans fulvus]|uniref:PHP domain-containing protein n=1 Tax=Solihabitans fulvus TaxID=1892852 RepID=A0A5B2XMR2_9PSEU|nr:PHP domain-containing protein [Solihabitans fulvus]KAA2264082.1 PHP domain-containing protein [Solihabitans fulvus]
MLIDLHTHSTESDGTDKPAELVAAAAAAGLDVVALTDHDTAAGWAEAAAALPTGLRLVRGAELSCAAPSGRGGTVTVHLLAYLYDPTSSVLIDEQLRLRAERRDRLRLMATQMAEAGFPVDPDAIMDRLPPDSPGGRPHLAQALVRAGVVESVNEAFAKYLGTGGRYHLPRTDTPVRRAVEMIRDAGGVTVLAHPFARSRGPVVTGQVIADLADLGLAGVEADHPDHDEETRAELRGLAGELGLVVTGSSDYHGTNKTVRLGQETTAPEMLDALVDKATGAEVLTG